MLLVGDAIIDEYQYVLPMGRRRRRTSSPPASTIARCSPAACSRRPTTSHRSARRSRSSPALGARDSHEDADPQGLKPNVTPDHPRRGRRADDAQAPLRRSLPHAQAVRGLLHERRRRCRPTTQASFDRLIAKRARDFDVVIVTDFGHGADRPLHGRRADARGAASSPSTRRATAPIIGFNLITKYPRADYVCIDAPEARLAIGDKFGDLIDAHRARTCAELVDCDKIIVTARQARLRHLPGRGGPPTTSRPSPSRSSTRSAPAMRSSR